MPESSRCAGRAPWRRSGAKTRLKGGTLAGVMVSFAAQHHQFGGPLNGRPAHHGGLGTLDATVLTFAPAHLPALPELTALRHLVDDPFAPTCWQPAGEDEEAIVADIAQIAVDCARYGGNRLGTALLAHELAVLLVRIAAL